MVDRIKAEEWPKYLEDVLSTHERAQYADELNNWHTFLELETLASWDRQASPEGQGWPEWQWRNWQYHHIATPLVNTGRLYESFVRGGGGESIDEITGRMGRYGSAVPYAGTHQYGEVGAAVTDELNLRGNPWVVYPDDGIDIPERPMLGVREDMADVLAESIADSLVEQMKG